MVIANFDKGSTREDVFRIYQYNYGQVLRIQGLTLPTAVEVHFSLQNTGGETTTRIGVTKDGVTDVVIPDSLLENGYTTQDYEIYAFVYLRNETSGQTEYKIALHITSRPKPEAFDRPEDAEIFKEAIKAVNESAARSAESEKQAEGWAHGREDLPERAQDNAKYYSEQAREDSKKTDADRKEVQRLVESVSGIDEQVTKVENLTKQAQTSATNAALSEQAAKESENNATQAGARAEVAEDNAELAAQKVEQDKAIVEQAKNIVKQMRQEVLDNKNLVDETAQDFTLKAQQALADVNNAGHAQTERVQTAGNDAVESVKAAQGTATRAVETAKTEAIEAVQTEGATQAGNVSAEGEKQVQAVRGAAQEIMADREQIQENKTGITKLKEDIVGLDNRKADAIVETVIGTMLNIKDSAYAKIVNLKINKNVDWVKITGKNLLNVQGEKTGNGINLMEFGTGRIKYTTQDNYGGGYVKYSKNFEAGEYVFSAKTTNDGVVDNNGIRLGFDKEVSIKNNQLIYNNYYKMYFMNNYSNKIQITASEPFIMMIAVNLKSSVKGSLIEIFDIQLEQGTVNTEYESYCEEQNVVAPITEDKINALHTNYPTTIVTNSEDAEMQLTYVADTKNYYLRREQAIQNQILEIQNALISQKISGGV